jgi:hypothetical protein
LCTVDALGHTGGQRPRPDALHVYGGPGVATRRP